MCGICGCAGAEDGVTMTDPEGRWTKVLRRGSGAAGRDHHHDHDHDHDHDHSHDHDHDHDHDHPHPHAADQRTGLHGEAVRLEAAVMSKNNAIATRNRGWFDGRGVLALNLVSSPGAGKTTLLEQTIRALNGTIEVCVIEGDQMTANDAERIRRVGARAIQINTGSGCHLEADMVASAVAELNPPTGSIVMIENVGNLVCPAMFDLGERMKVAVISTPEGEDKPLKYPHMFRAASIVIINKIDLAPHVGFDEELCRANIAKTNPEARILSVSARTGHGMEVWLDFLRTELAAPV